MTAFFVIKIIISALIIATVTEIAKRYTSVGGLIAAMPITTLLSIIWLYYEKTDLTLLSNFTSAVFWGIWPTLLFFISAMYLFKKGWNFYLVLLISFIFLGIGVYIHQKFVH